MESDPIKDFVSDSLSWFQGSGGDAVVIISLLIMLLMIYRQKYKAAVGWLFLVCGTVAIRFSVSFLFSVGEM